MDKSIEQTIHISAGASFDETVEDINTDEINEVLEDDSEVMENTTSEGQQEQTSVAEDEAESTKEQNKIENGNQNELEESSSDKQQIESFNTVKEKDESAEKCDIKSGTEKEGKSETKKSNEHETSKQSTSKKLLRMQLSTQTLQKLLKEGKMEKLPTGSFRISADALKELKKEKGAKEATVRSTMPVKVNSKKRKFEEEIPDDSDDDYDDDEDDEDDEDIEEKGEENGTESLQTTNGKTVRSKVPAIKNTTEKNTTNESTSDKSPTKLDNSDMKKSETKSVALKKKKLCHDYISDFNSSEDEDDEMIANLQDSLAELAPKKQGHLSKPVALLFEQLHKTMFGDISDDSADELEKDEDKSHEECIRQLALSDPDFGKHSSGHSINDIPSDFWMVGRIGNNCKTKMCIRSTDKKKSFEGHEYPVYNIDTGVGSVTTVTPLMVTALNVEALEHEKTSTVNLPDPELVAQLQMKTISLRKYKEQVKLLRRRYLALARQVATRPQLQTIGDLVAASARFLTQDQLLFFTMQLKAGCDATQGARFSLQEKLLSLALYQQHPETYKWLHRLFNLPSTAVLERWLDTVARGNPTRCKKLMYHVYTRYCFKPREDMVHQIIEA